MIKTIYDLEHASPTEIEAAQAALSPYMDLDEYLEEKSKKKHRNETLEYPCRMCGGSGVFKQPPRETYCVHPSSIARCSRQIAFELIGYEDRVDDQISPRIRRLFDTGHAVHFQLQSYCTDMYGDAFQAEVDGEDEEIRAYGSCDGVLEWAPYLCRNGFEYKTIKEQGFHKLGMGPKSDHKLQGIIYQSIHDLPWMVYWYYNKNTSAMREFVVPFDFKVWERVEKKVFPILDALKEKRFPSIDIGDWACRDCKYKPICAEGDPEL